MGRKTYYKLLKRPIGTGSYWELDCMSSNIEYSIQE